MEAISTIAWGGAVAKEDSHIVSSIHLLAKQA